MSATTTKASDTAAPTIAPPAQLPAVTGKEAWETFRDELNKRAEEIGSQLPPNIPRERFLGAALAAVKSTPGILMATPRSLMSALTKAAQDGLLPDGREGIITVYQQKVPNTSPQQYENVAQWNPMFYGIRKRARELDGIIIDAQVVFADDGFEYSLGDNPHIDHKPKPRMMVLDASAGIAAYAIFRHPEQGILHREVMWKPEVFAVMNQSRAKGSLMWTTFWTEGWRKTVGRRGAKSVPVSPQLERLIQRDDENFVFGNDQQTLALPTPPSPPSAPPSQIATSNDAPKRDAADFNDDASEVTDQPESSAEFLARIEHELSFAMSAQDIEEAFDLLDVPTVLGGDDASLTKAFATKQAHLARAAKAVERPFPLDVPLTKEQKIARTP